MNPFLRAVDPEHPDVPPPGQVAEPAGTWGGRQSEVVFDPRRHDVAFIRGTTTPELTDRLASAGWVHQASDGDCQFWVRDRLEQARRRLSLTHPRPAAPRIA
ncbi:MAG TPA: hypothetical protein VFJ85_08530 [Acidimicrobiales bacterium]|nr:hypothetical protein [Acidimicrobiales bacterium]